MKLRVLLPLLAFVFFCPSASTAQSGKAPQGAPPQRTKDYSAELPRIPPREPADALRTFRLHPDFRVELVAAEPLIRSPVALDFDENGRMFVAEFPEYNQYVNKEFKGHGCIKLLTDTKGDGRYDRATIFADNLDSPVALACYDGGVFVGAVPSIFYCKDTHGDGIADLRKPAYTGFGKDEAGEAMLNSFRWGLDNRFHLSTSLAGGNVRRADQAGARPVSVRGQSLVFDPRTLAFELTSGGGQHGLCMDDWGHWFVCGNSDPIQQIVYDSRYLARNPYVQAPPAAIDIAPEGKYTKLNRLSPNEPWRVLRTRLRTQGLVPGSDEGGRPSGFFTGASGVTVYRGNAWPEKYEGNVFIGEVANNLVYRARLLPHGVQFVAQGADRDAEFLASTDNWFRPVQFANAPDGTLYVIDMYREFIEAAVSVPPEILRHLDVSSGIDRGRIYRIVPKGFKQPKPPRLGNYTTAELVALLEHANGWHRDTAARLLYQRQDKSAVGPLKSLARQSRSPLGRLYALCALDGLGALDPSLVLHGLNDADARVREHCIRFAERFEGVPSIRAKLSTLKDDSDLNVRYQLAFSLGRVQGEMPTSALVRLAIHDAGDSWMTFAILCSATERAGEMFSRLSAEKKFRETDGATQLLAALAGQIGAANRPADLTALELGIERLPPTEDGLARLIVGRLVRRQTPAGRAALKGTSARVLQEILCDARRMALKDDSDRARDEAVRALGLAPFAETGQLLKQLLDVRQPQLVQQTVLETLATFDEPQVPPLVLKAWPTLTPQLRATAAETLFSRPPWIDAFLDAVEKGVVKTADVNPARIQLLRVSADPRVRSRASKLFAGAQLGSRQDVVAAYQKALQLKGDAAHGKAIFKNVCSTCHRLEGIGEAVGADLSAIRDRGSASILLSILDPNREVLPQYLAYILATNNGRFLTGMISAETANSITIRRADGTSETVPRVAIEELRGTGLSFMPEGLEKQITVQGMADLIAYLNSAR
jgi:putative membrane-bound dehydrogenase-like protein